MHAQENRFEKNRIGIEYRVFYEMFVLQSFVWRICSPINGEFWKLLLIIIIICFSSRNGLLQYHSWLPVIGAAAPSKNVRHLLKNRFIILSFSFFIASINCDNRWSFSCFLSKIELCLWIVNTISIYQSRMINHAWWFT